MAFIHCPNCGRQVYSLAHVCPNCGYSLDVAAMHTVFCQNCGAEIRPTEIHGDSAFCLSCGKLQTFKTSPMHVEPIEEPVRQFVNKRTMQEEGFYPTQNNIFIRESRSNGMGIAGFVLAILAILLCWVPVLGAILWFLGWIFSFIGMFNSPKGLAVAGFVITTIPLLLLLCVLLFILFVSGKESGAWQELMEHIRLLM